MNGVRTRGEALRAADERAQATAALRKLVLAELSRGGQQHALGADVLEAVVRQLAEEFEQERLLDPGVSLETLVSRVWADFGEAKVREHLPGTDDWTRFHLAVRADITDMSRQPDFADRLREFFLDLRQTRSNNLATDVLNHAFALALAKKDASSLEFVLGELGAQVDRGTIRAWILQVHRHGRRDERVFGMVDKHLFEQGRLPNLKEVLTEVVHQLQGGRSELHAPPSGDEAALPGDAPEDAEESGPGEAVEELDAGGPGAESAEFDDDGDSEDELSESAYEAFASGLDNLDELVDWEDFQEERSGAALGEAEAAATAPGEEEPIVVDDEEGLEGRVIASIVDAQARNEARRRRAQEAARRPPPKLEAARPLRAPLKRRRRGRSSSRSGGRAAELVRSRSRDRRRPIPILRPARHLDRVRCEPRPEPYAAVEQGGMLVVYKPAFWTATTSMAEEEIRTSRVPTLLGWLRSELGEKYPFLRANPRAGLCHRLDVQTSGPIVVGTNEEVMVEMRENLRRHMWYKEYLALMHGAVPLRYCCGVLNYRLLTKPDYGKGWRTQVDGRGENAVTRYEAIEVYRHRAVQKSHAARYTLLRLHLITGKTHQIRVHLQEFARELDFPVQGIVGDYKYLPPGQLRDDRRLCGRVFLHAYQLHIPPPGDSKGERIRVQCPLPVELQRVLNNLELDEHTTSLFRERNREQQVLPPRAKDSHGM